MYYARHRKGSNGKWRKKKKKKRNRPLLLSLDHGSNTITMGASRPTGCTAVSYQSTQRTLALRREIMDEFLGLILFRCYQSVVHLQRSPSLSLHPHPDPTHTHFPRVPFTLHPSKRLPAPCVFAVLFSSMRPTRPGDCDLRNSKGGERGWFYPSKPAHPPHLLPGPVSPPLFCAMSLFSPLCSQPSVSKRTAQNEPPKPEKQKRNN